MPEHRPKTAALIAYSEDLLSDEGRRRVERHLDGCEVCRAELAAMELYEEMVDSVHSTPMPKVDFDSMEMSLAHEAASVSRELRAQKQRRRWGPYAVAALAAAAALGLWVWSQQPAEPVADAPEPTEEAPVAEDRGPVLLSPEVTLAAGRPVRIDADREQPLDVGDRLPEGSRLRVDEGGEVHVRLSSGTGIVAREGTELTLARARETEVRIELAAGEVGQQVASLEEEQRYWVLADGYEVEVTGTRFTVSRRQGVIGVDLTEGSVVVRTPEGETHELSAPARWRSDGSRLDGDPAMVSVRELSEASAPLTEVRFDHPDVVRWLFDETALSALGPVALRAPPGEYELSGWDSEGHLLRVTLPVGETPVAVEPDALVPESPHLQPGHLEPEEIQPVLARGSRQIERCYELALRNGSSVTGHARLRIHLAVDGTVRRAQVLGLSGEGAAAIRQCISNYASRWTFPPPGGPLRFDQPLNFAPIQ